MRRHCYYHTHSTDEKAELRKVKFPKSHRSSVMRLPYEPSLSPVLTLSATAIFVSARWLTRSSRGGRTQEALKPLGARYLLLQVLEGAGIENQVPRASLCALGTPRSRGELERLFTTLKGSANRRQIGMG